MEFDREIKNGLITLKQNNNQDFEYIYRLVRQDKYWQISKEELKKTIEKYSYVIWEVFYGNEKVGIICIHYRPELGYCLDGYKDESKKTYNKISFKSGRFFTQYMLNKVNKLFTFHSENNKGATSLCYMLGFKQIDRFNYKNNNFLLFEARRQ